MCIQNFVRFCQFFLDIERKGNSDVNQRPKLSKILPKIVVNNPKPDIVNIDVHTKFGQILSIHSQDNERK